MPSPAKAQPVTLQDCLAQATRYWETKRGSTSRVMAMRCQTCIDLLGGPRKDGGKRKAEDLTRLDVITLLANLKGRQLSASSQASYYAAFRRMLALNGVSTIGWPDGATPPRRTREPLTEGAIRALRFELRGGEERLEELRREHDFNLVPDPTRVSHNPTEDLLIVLKATGMRVDVEALSFEAWEIVGHKLLRVRGKGGHERVIPVEDEEAWAVLLDPERINPMRRLSYSAHLKRWKKATSRAGITSRLPTPHAIRHYYATQAYARCKDIRVVQELLGHSDIATTARYIGADMDTLRAAVSSDA